mgnify:CR=1 FL=1
MVPSVARRTVGRLADTHRDWEGAEEHPGRGRVEVLGFAPQFCGVFASRGAAFSIKPISDGRTNRRDVFLIADAKVGFCLPEVKEL